MRKKQTTNCTNHCGSCHLHFHSLNAFDKHRLGNYQDGRRCEHPIDILDSNGEMVFRKLTEHGVCDIYNPTQHDVIIWTTALSEREAARYLRLASESNDENT